MGGGRGFPKKWISENERTFGNIHVTCLLLTGFTHTGLVRTSCGKSEGMARRSSPPPSPAVPPYLARVCASRASQFSTPHVFSGLVCSIAHSFLDFPFVATTPPRGSGRFCLQNDASSWEDKRQLSIAAPLRFQLRGGVVAFKNSVSTGDV